MVSKTSAEHNEGLSEPRPEHEALLPGVMALANLFSNTVEAFGLIRASQRWEREEQLLLARLGVQQARLLIWGDILGVSSPPASVTNRAVPKHPSAAYPDLSEPTFFTPRDARLDEPETRTQIEDALSSIVDRSAHTTRDEMMEKFGLKPPKRFTPDTQPALDTTRLEAFREKYELLKEVAESYARINSRRTNSIVMQTWTISDRGKFASFIRLTQEKIDSLVEGMSIGDRVDRAMRMDIRNFGWHLTADRARVAQDVSKLKLIQDACRDDYPQYIVATQQALDNISREARENSGLGGPYNYNPYSGVSSAEAKPKPEVKAKPVSAPSSNGASNPNSPTKTNTSNPPTPKRPFLGGLFKSFRQKSKDSGIPKSSHHKQQHSQDLKQQQQQQNLQPTSNPVIEPTPDPDRSLSDAGPTTHLAPPTNEGLERVRSKSLDAGPSSAAPTSGGARFGESSNSSTAPAVGSLDDQMLREAQDGLSRLDTRDTVHVPLEQTETVRSMISRHDQYRAG